MKLLILFALSSFCFSKNQANEKNPVYKVLVVQASDKSYFEYSPAKKSVLFKNNVGKLSEFNLNDKGVKHLDSLLPKESFKSDDLKKCLDKYIQFSLNSKFIYGCIGNSSSAALSLTELTNAFGQLFMDQKK